MILYGHRPFVLQRFPGRSFIHQIRRGNFTELNLGSHSLPLRNFYPRSEKKKNFYPLTLAALGKLNPSPYRETGNPLLDNCNYPLIIIRMEETSSPPPSFAEKKNFIPPPNPQSHPRVFPLGNGAFCQLRKNVGTTYNFFPTPVNNDRSLGEKAS